MSEPKEYRYYSHNGQASGKAYRSFMEFAHQIVKELPNSVKFTSPDIELLEKQNQELKKDAKKLVRLLSRYCDCFMDSNCDTCKALTEWKGKHK